MKINSIHNFGVLKLTSTSSMTNNNFGVSTRNITFTSYPENDIFVNNLNISFTGAKKSSKESDLPSAITKAGGVVGGGFLLGLAVSTGMSKLGDKAKDIVLDPNGYEISENGIVSDNVTIDADDGIIKIEGTPISIDADKYDYVDWEKGIFRNYDGSVDIDLLGNKFIDAENGIFVDPDYGIAAVLDGEHFENVAIPDFNTSFGSGKSMVPWDDWGRSNSPGHQREPNIVEDGFIKTAVHNIKQLFGMDAKSVETEDFKDIFGNDIIKTVDSKGDTYLTTIPGSDNPIFSKVSGALGNNEVAAQVYNNAKLSAYLEEKHPSFGTRVLVYEGGRNAGLHLPEMHERYNMDNVNKVLDGIRENGGYMPEPGSQEAIDFVKYQDFMIKNGFLENPMISPNDLLDIDGDGVADIDLDGDGIPDYDIDGDGIIDFSSENDGNAISNIINGIFTAIKGFFAGGD